MKQIELKVLKLLLYKSFWKQHGDKVSTKLFSSEMKGLIKTINHLHKKDPIAVLSTESVYHLYEFKMTTTVAKLNLIKQILDEVDSLKALSPESTLEIIQALHEKEAARKIAEQALLIVQRSDNSYTLSQLKEFVGSLDVQQTDTTGVESSSTSIDDIKKYKEQRGIFSFTNGLEQIVEYVPTLSRGQFVIVFASTNAGKSSFVAQLAVGYLQQGHKVLYFGNEEPIEDITLNFVRSTEGLGESVLFNTPLPNWNKIRHNLTMIPAHGLSLSTLETAIKQYKPDVVIYDQLDNVPVDGVKDRRHEALENLYQTTRQWGATYDMLSIALSQANDAATGKLHLRNNMMANSRIGKAGAADLVVGIGMKSVDNPQRSICICKNKITGKHGSIHMMLNSEICRYEM